MNKIYLNYDKFICLDLALYTPGRVNNNNNNNNEMISTGTYSACAVGGRWNAEYAAFECVYFVRG